MSVKKRREYAHETLGEYCFLGSDVVIPLSVSVARACKRSCVDGMDVKVYPDLIFGGVALEFTDTISRKRK